MSTQQVQTLQQTNVGELLIKYKKQIEAALPKHLTADRMIRVFMTEIRKNPKLLMCSQASFMNAMIQCAQLGLEPGVLGHAYLIPYDKKRKDKKTGVWLAVETECQLIVGYRGMLDLIGRSGKLKSISVHEVYSNDKFDLQYGLDEKCTHIPALNDRGDMIGVYVLVRLKDEAYQLLFMSKEDIEKVRQSSKAKDDGPWVTNYDEMAKKTVIRRLFKYLPVSIELQKAVAIDEATDRGEQYSEGILEGEFENLAPHAVKAQTKSQTVLEKLNANPVPQQKNSNPETVETPTELDKSWDELKNDTANS